MATITLWMAGGELGRISDLAKSSGRTRSSLIREAIADFLEGYDREC
jgi:predicted transcriptional regulator